MIDSLLAIKILLLNFIIAIVGSRPAKPGIAQIVMLKFLQLIDLKLFNINVLFDLNFFFTLR